jgi:hypothetical protein
MFLYGAKMSNTTEEYETLVRNALKQPGIKELMEVYGQYEDLVRQTNEYLFNVTPRPEITSSNSTA